MENINIYNSKILVVDDEGANVKFIEQVLDEEGFTSVRSTTDSREATGIYKDYRPDLVLLDLKMPHLDGFQVLEQLKAIDPDVFPSILVVTAQHDQDTRIRALEAGARDFLGKPFFIPEILCRIRNILEVRLLHNQVTEQNKNLESEVRKRTAELCSSQLQVNEGEKRLKTIVNAMLDGLITVDETGTIFSFNKAAEKIFGYRMDEVVNKKGSDLISPAERDKQHDFFSAPPRIDPSLGISTSKETTGLRKDGTTFLLEYTISHMLIGSKSFLIGTVRDITERREAEKRLEEKADMLANVVKDHLF